MILAPVACISPTFNRADWHERLYAVFASQSHGNKVLVVVDDSPAPSPFFASLRDPRVRYVHDPRRTSIGEKRNRCVRLASDASFVAHLDDDDWYAPTYLSRMLASMAAVDADLAKLSVWNAVLERDGSRWRWDTRTVGGVHCAVNGEGDPRCFVVPRSDGGAMRDAALWGYGFSYVYKRSLWAAGPFPDRNSGEDYAFLRAARERGARCLAVADGADLVWHTVHPRSTSRMFPQERLDAPTPRPVNGGQSFVLPALFDAVVGGARRAPRSVSATVGKRGRS